MLRELPARQIEGDDFRRIFSGDNLRLYVWYLSGNYRNEEDIMGFQLCFEEGDQIVHLKKSLIWKKRGGYILEDDDEPTGSFDQDSVLISLSQNRLNNQELAEKFSNSGKNIDEKIRDFVFKKIEEYE